jgi:hypothetical protein
VAWGAPVGACGGGGRVQMVQGEAQLVGGGGAGLLPTAAMEAVGALLRGAPRHNGTRALQGGEQDEAHEGGRVDQLEPLLNPLMASCLVHTQARCEAGARRGPACGMACGQCTARRGIQLLAGGASQAALESTAGESTPELRVHRMWPVRQRGALERRDAGVPVPASLRNCSSHFRNYKTPKSVNTLENLQK